MSTNTNGRSWIVTLLLAASALGYVFFLFLPGQKAIADLRGQLRTKQDLVTQMSSVAQQMQHMEKQLSHARQYTGVWEATAPGQVELSSLFSAITTHTKQAGTKTIRFDPQSAVKMDTVRKIPVVLESEGSFGQIFDLLNRLENLRPTIWIDDLLLEGDGENGENTKCELTMVIFADNPDISD